jgi:hypothetical protein
VDRFAHLPEHTREFLAGLSRDDIAVAADLLRSYKRAATIGWFFKWLTAACIAVFLAASQVSNGWKAIISWFGR